MADIDKQVEEATSAVGAVVGAVGAGVGPTAKEAQLSSGAAGTGTGRCAPGGGGAHQSRDSMDVV